MLIPTLIGTLGPIRHNPMIGLVTRGPYCPWTLVTVGIVQDAARLGEALPRLAVALGAEPGRRNDAVGFEAAAAALDLEHGHLLHARGEGIVGRKLSLGREAFHADRHTLRLLRAKPYTHSPEADGW